MEPQSDGIWMSRGAAEWLSRLEVKLDHIGVEVVENRRVMDVHIQELKDANEVLREAYDEMILRRERNEQKLEEHRQRIEVLERAHKTGMWWIRGVISAIVTLFITMHEHIFGVFWHWMTSIAGKKP